MPSYEFIGGDPIEHFYLGTVQPGDVVELDDEPAGPWKPSKRKAKISEHDSDAPDTSEEG